MSLKFGALLIAYNQEEYIEYCIRAVAPHVDVILVIFSEVPFTAYNPKAREMFAEPDATRAILERLKLDILNLLVIEGTWDAEEPMRNEGLSVLRANNVDICLILDPDEIYPDGTLPLLKKEIMKFKTPGTVFVARYRNCYRRLDYVIDSPKFLMPVAVHITSEVEFVDGREPAGPKEILPGNIFYWHFGYVLSDKRMWEKINTFSHSREILKGWYESKWLQWTPKTTQLSRKEPASRWPIANRIGLDSLPEIMRSHPFYLVAMDNPAKDKV